MSSRKYHDRIEFLEPTRITGKSGVVQYQHNSTRPPTQRMASVEHGQSTQIEINDEQQTDYDFMIELPFDSRLADVDENWVVVHYTRQLPNKRRLNIAKPRVIENGRHPTMMIAAKLER